MSRIYFHSEHGSAELRGSERAYMSIFCVDLMMSVFGDMHYAKDWLLPLVPPTSYVHKSDDIERTLETYLRVQGDLRANDKSVDTFEISLNTAWAIGGDALRLMARLHGQCEVHCWVEGQNRKWLYDIIAAGRKSGLLRGKQGWEEVAAFLVSRDDCPVVCSYSVCEQFPNFGCLPGDHPLKQGKDENASEQFYELDDSEAWSACMQELRAQGSGLEMRPDKWGGFYFGHGATAFSLRQAMSDAVANAGGPA